MKTRGRERREHENVEITEVVANQQTLGRNRARDAQLQMEDPQSSSADALQPARSLSPVWNSAVDGQKSCKSH